ncbi:MAG: molecular chaperone HtpG [Cognaticolwellia sp.]|jgi:molecular chaperone HtpG
MQRGNISVQTENIFPIIKQFLYSDQEIFLRELVSNAVDATNKLKTLSRKGIFNGDLGDTAIEVIIDEAAKTLTIRDRGIGMTEEEVNKYLNQVAFSSASEFLEKYKDENSIIGHFGLGFYSAFMVADKVEVKTLSYQDDSEGVTWSCEGNPEYGMEANDKSGRGTDIVLHISEDSVEFLGKSRIEGLLEKYCKFLPIEIRFEGEIINNPEPIWKKNPVDLTDEDYLNFYKELHPHGQPPLFWIHLNIDHPFSLTGILYFPELNNSLESQRNKIQLYCNQVYVTDDLREIVPEFLTLLHGVIDSPDIPLNVSRSYLQSDKNVRQIRNYITRKVADKLHDLFKSDRKDYQVKWDNIGTLVKYGMISEEKFNEKAMKFALLKNLDNEYFTVEEYKAKIEVNQQDKNERLIGIYTTSPIEHHSFVEAAKTYGYDVLGMDTVIDNHFMQHLEAKVDKLSFTRVDANTAEKLIEKDETRESVLSEDEQNTVKAAFEGQVGVGATVTVEALSPDDQPVIITKPEFMRRMREMSAMQGMAMGDMPEAFNVVINTNHPILSSKLLSAENETEQGEVVKYLYNLALLNQGMLKGADLSAFINKSLGFLN